MATRLPCGMSCRYLDRLPERLVVEGFRCWMQGYESGSIAVWERAACLFTDELGATDGHKMLGELSRWVDAVRSGMDRPVGLSPGGCPRLCQDECVAVAMIAASQARDAESLDIAVDLILAPESRADAIRAARLFADALADGGHWLLPVPGAIIREIADRPERGQFH